MGSQSGGIQWRVCLPDASCLSFSCPGMGTEKEGACKPLYIYRGMCRKTRRVARHGRQGVGYKFTTSTIKLN